MQSYVSATSSNQWVHIMVSIDKASSNISVYTDGLILDSLSNLDFTLNANVASQDLLIGGSMMTGSNFNGYIDDFTIFNEVLTQEKITSNVYNSYNLLEADLVPLNQWSHVVANYDKYRKKEEIFINGSYIGYYENYEPASVNNANDLVVGKSFTGSIGEVILFERPMFKDEVNILYSTNDRFLFIENILKVNFQTLSLTNIVDTSPYNHTVTLLVPAVYDVGHISGSKALKFTASQVATLEVTDTFDYNFMTLEMTASIAIGANQTLMKKDGVFEWCLDSTGKQRITFDSGSTYHTATTSITTNTFTTLAVQIDRYNSTVTFYKDNVVHTALTSVTFDLATTNTNNITIGSQTLTGKISEMIIDLGYGKYNKSTFDYTPVSVIASYTFDESSSGVSTIDKSMYHNSATLMNGASRIFGTYDVQSKGLSLNNSSGDQYVSIPGSIYTTIDLNTVTMSAWIYTALGTVKSVIKKTNSFDWGLNTTGYIQLIDSVNTRTYTATTTAVVTNTWTHIATTVNEFSKEIIFYVNGVKLNTLSATTFNLPMTDSELMIGKGFTGKLDNVIIHKGIVNFVELTSIYTSPAGRYDPPRIANNEWSHVAAVYDKHMNMVTMYKDGTYAGCYENYLTDFKNIGTNSNNMYIATRGDNMSFFDGTIDDIRVYKKALTATDVSELYGMYLKSPNYINESTTPVTVAFGTVANVIDLGTINLKEPTGVTAGLVTLYAFVLDNNRLSGKSDIELFLPNIGSLTENTHYYKRTFTTTGTYTSTWDVPTFNYTQVLDSAFTSTDVSLKTFVYAYVVSKHANGSVNYFKQLVNRTLPMI
jgi:hypothetical protein